MIDRLVNLDMLIEKLGPDHGAMHHDLVDKFTCSVCPVEGRGDRRAVFFTIVQNYERDRQMRIAHLGTEDGLAKGILLLVTRNLYGPSRSVLRVQGVGHGSLHGAVRAANTW